MRRARAAGSACRYRATRVPELTASAARDLDLAPHGAMIGPPGRFGGAVNTLAARLEETRSKTAGRWLWYGACVGVTAALYYGAARAGLRLAYLNGAVTAFWPPVGVGIAALALGGLRLWPAIVIGDLLVGDFSTPIGTVLGQTVGNTLEVVVAAAILLRLASGRTDLERVLDVLALVVAAAAGTLLSAVVGTLSLRLGHVIS